MGNKVRDLEKQLEKAKLAEVQESLDKELKRQKKAWLGKARSTHTFTRIGKRIHAYIEKIVDVVLLGDDEVYLKVEAIEFVRDKDVTRIEVKEVHKLWHHNHHYTHDITTEEYDNLKDVVKGELINIGEKFREGMRKPDESHTMGDHRDYRNIQERLVAAKAPFVDIGKMPEFIRTLAWQDHPMLMGNVLLVTPYTEQILRNIKQGFLDSANRTFSGKNAHSYHKDAELIQAIIDYYKKYT